VLTVALVRTLRQVARARVELEASHGRLERANQDLDAFAGRIAHDLRNVIAPLGLMADTLGQGATDTRTVQRAAERLQRLTDNADGLIGALLDFARSGGEPAGTRESTLVVDVIRDVVADLAPLSATRRASVQIEANDVTVRCSRSLLQTVLMNLVGNALKYLDGEARVVRLSARAVGSDCEIAVSDSGPGIPADALESIFEPFYRVPGAAAPGTGIGLATVHRIVQAHHGQVSVQSSVGDGSQFVVRLPAGKPEPPHGT
jgi:signal transduction histidine kinase